MKIIKTNHIELSVGGTEIIASKKCPLTSLEINNKNQIFNDTICCVVNGQGPGKSFACPHFQKAWYDTPVFEIECDLIKN